MSVGTSTEVTRSEPAGIGQSSLLRNAADRISKSSKTDPVNGRAQWTRSTFVTRGQVVSRTWPIIQADAYGSAQPRR